ncbi:DEAD/DEAH box helicase [Lacinutrix algicola]|uniref:DEAD/DEAH box helicase n=1 Tax=Lacinutrix algicola TaxID=342954 RepID=UPI0006E2877C|nr:DEAD/DEAH box helicase [Lacinutrix algicola]
MSLPKFYKHYKIAPNQLKKILKEHDIEADIRFVKSIPNDWINIVSKVTGIEDYKSKKNSVIVKTPKEDLELKLDTFKQLEIIKPNNKDANDHKLAYVKYVAPDESHAYLKVIDDLENISENTLRENSENDYKIHEDCNTLENGQLVIVSIKGEKCKISNNYFSGSIITTPIKRFTDWVNFNQPLHIQRNVQFLSRFNNFDLVALKLSIYRKTIKCIQAPIDPDNNQIIFILKSEFIKALNKTELTTEELAVIHTYKVNSNDYEQLLDLQFQKDVTSDFYYANETNFLTFINKWRVLNLEYLVLSSVKHTEHIHMYLELWFDQKINNNFWENHLIDALINLELKAYENSEKFQLSFYDKLLETHVEEISLAMDSYFQNELVTDSIKVFNILEQLVEVSNCINKDSYIIQLKNSLAPELAFEFWLQDDQAQFPKEIAINNFESLDIKTQERAINLISDNELKLLITQIKEINKREHRARINRILKQQIPLIFNPLSFDIESDTESIFEIAWNEGDEWKFYKDHNSIPDGINIFKNKISKNENLIIGHNIISFDLPILKNHNIEVNTNSIWDTIQIESLLSPEFNNYALATSHTAKMDAQLTLNLFLNQILRIIKTPKEDLIYLFEYLPKDLTNKIEKYKALSPIKLLDLTSLKKEAESFFRPQAKQHPILKKLKETLNTSQKVKTLIIGDEGLRLELSKALNIQFLSESETEYQYEVIDEDKLENIRLNSWLKNVIKSYLYYAKKNNLNPVFGNLAPYVQNKITTEINDISVILKSENNKIFENYKVLFISIMDLLNRFEDLNKNKEIQIIVLQPDFLATSKKIKLKELDLQELTIASNNINHLWMKFSGGQSYVQLSKQECITLNIDCPPLLTNFWIEKYKYAKYSVWGNYNWEELINKMSPNKVINIYLDEESKDHTYFTKINAAASYSNDALRFNPESIYRSRYWVYQKELINQISSNKIPSILLVERQDEIEVLENYFKKLGFFVPDNRVGIARRLEFIHNNRTQNKIIIEHVSNLNKILINNYLGALNIIMDSFNLAGNYYIAQETSYFKNLAQTQQNQPNTDNKDVILENEDFNTPKKPLLKDTFFLLKLLKPQISNYRNIINNYNSEHKFWLLDSRIADFPNLGRLWNIKSRSLNVWHSKEAYEVDLKLADLCIPGVRPLDDLPFSIEEIKTILSNVFLNGGKWYDYQEPYLDLIIPGKTDVLVTLPTGGGKSLLFQAPALFKSSFTNRLSIVVTPLKALMEDQVDKLWQNGFYGSVEYLNSDRSTDTQIIYRAMAGGEIALLFVTPERFRSRSFLNALEVRMQSDGGLEYVIFDEAHCVSQWGHEFRPDYFNCAKVVQRMKITSEQDIPLLLFSATVSEKIYQDFNQIFND